MKVAVAIDSFKGSLSTFRAGEAVACGIREVYPEAVVKVCPLADGGEGTVDAIVSAAGGEMRRIEVCGPLGRPVSAAYGILPETGMAVMEMSAAAGITLITDEERDPLYTTTYGVGEMIKDAIEKGCRRFLIGIGGSATNDGGVGMLQALGFSFLDKEGKEIARGAHGLADLSEIRAEGALPALKECEISVACDVKNPLCGPQGCSAVYGPQKGGTAETIPEMDAWLASYAALTKGVNPQADAGYPGAGAAGGMGFAFLSYLGGRLASGIELVIDAVGLEEHVRTADVVVTGEGRLDGQSCMGKAPVGVANLAKKHGKPVLAFSGCVTEEAKACNTHGIDAYFPILQRPVSLAEAMEEGAAFENLKNTAEQAFRVVKTFSNID